MKQRIRIGNQSSLSAPAVEPFEYAVSHGFDAFEWFLDPSETGQRRLEDALPLSARAAMRRHARDHDIRVSVHGSWQANPVAPGGLARLESDAALAVDIGASVFLAHLYADRGVDRYAEALTPLVARLEEAGLRLVIENTPDTSSGELNQLFRPVRRQLWGDRVGMCLDIGHANLCAETRNDYLGYLDRLEPGVPIVHLHLHENWGDGDTHLMLFTGPAARDPAGIEGLIARLQQREFAGSMILEQWPDPPGLLDIARDRLTALLQQNAGRGVAPEG